MRLRDKAIIVTGSTTGIGKAIAERCAAEGAHVLVHGLERDDGEAVAEALGAPLCIRDLTEPDAPEAIVAAAVSAFGKIDGLVNNAALVAAGTIDDTDGAVFDRFMAINVRAPYLLIRAALEQLSQTRGRVLNIGSINAYAGEENLLPYSISKGALMTMTRNLGDTLHRTHQIKVNQINPGWVLTENETQRKRSHGMPDDWFRQLPADWAPSGRILYPEEIAAAAVFWLADEAGPVSGCVVELEQYPAMGRNPTKK